MVVGDFAEYFADSAWIGVTKKHDEGPPSDAPIEWADLEPILSTPRQTSLRQLQRRGWGRMRRPRSRHPIPLQLAHPSGGAPERLGEHVRKVLDLFDVWGIIAAGSADDVEPLRTALTGIDIPLIVTTDSTTVSASTTTRNELRLMPSNRSQATALLFAASLHAPSGETEDGHDEQIEPIRQPSPIMYKCEATTGARRYVNDLREQLEEAAERLGIELVRFNPRRDPYPLIGIGYRPLAEKLLAERTAHRLTILSDGCATKDVRDAIYKRLGADASRWWFLSGPEATFDYLAAESFAAIREAGHVILGAGRGRAVRRPGPPTASLRDMIKQTLAATDRDIFQFEGVENVAPTYRIRSVTEHWDWPLSGPDTARRGTERRLPLQVVHGGTTA